jgi:hypothetical protein
MDTTRLETLLQTILENQEKYEKRLEQLEKPTTTLPPQIAEEKQEKQSPVTNDANNVPQDTVNDQEWLQQTNTPVATQRTNFGQRTIRRLSSMFAPTNEIVSTPDVTTASSLHVSVPRYSIDPETMLKKCTVPGIIYLMDLHEDYLKRQPEAKILSFRKKMAEFCSPPVLEEVFSNEKSLNTALSLTLNRYQDLMDREIPDEHFLAACARVLRPKSQQDFYNALRKVTEKYSLPKIKGWQSNETDYVFRIEKYESLLFKEMDKLIRITFDAIEFMYQDANSDDLRRLPDLGWGSRHSPDTLRLALACFEPYTNSLIKALGGQHYLDTNAKVPSELRNLLNLWNQKQVAAARKLQDEDADLVPMQSVKDLQKQYMLEAERKKEEIRKKDDYRRAHQIEGENWPETPVQSTSAPDFDHSQIFPDEEPLDESNLMYATPYSARSTTPAVSTADYRESTYTNVCHGVLYRNHCEQGKDCTYGHDVESILLEVETCLRLLVASPSVGEKMIYDTLAKIKKSPGLPKSSKPMASPSPTPFRTPLAPGRFAGRGGGNLYNPASRTGGGRGYGSRGDVRVLDGSGSFGDDVSGVGSAAPESLTHEA